MWDGYGIRLIFRNESECWTMQNKMRKEFSGNGDTAELNWILKIAGISRLKKIRNEDIKQFLGI